MVWIFYFRWSWPLAAPFAIAAVLNAGLWWLLRLFPSGGMPIILRFHATSGVDLLGSRVTLSVIPSLAAFVLLTNAALAAYLAKRDPFLARLLAWGTVFLQIFFGMALAALYFANRS